MNDNIEKRKYRITDILKDYWNNKRGENPYPAESNIDSDELGEIWENCFLVEVLDGGKNFKYEYLGNQIVEAYATDMEGQEVVEDLLYPESPDILAKFRETMQFCQPLEYDGAFINRNNSDIKFRKILLPLGSGGKVNYILGAMRWRVF